MIQMCVRFVMVDVSHWIMSESVSGWSNWSSAGRATGAAFSLAVVT